jgi:beta-glucanase (GH16 family)
MKKNLILFVLGFVSFLQVCYSQNSGQKTLPDTTIDQILFLDSMEELEANNALNGTSIARWTRDCGYQGRDFPKLPLANIIKHKPDNDINLCNDSAYILVFQDDFDTKLDRTFWSNAMEELKGAECEYWAPNGWSDHDVTEICDDVPGRAEQWYKQDHAYTENGVLKLKTDEDLDHRITGQAPLREWFVYKNNQKVPMSKHLQFNSGRIDSKFEFQYGMFQAKIKLPDMHGLWPAFWLYGSQDWNEIDIFEFFDNVDKHMRMTIHREVDGEKRQCSKIFEADDAVYFQKYHIYTCYWNPYAITIHIADEDGSNEKRLYLYRHYFGVKNKKCTVEANKWGEKQLVYPETPMRIIFNTAVQICEKNKPTTGSNSMPRYYEVDWIKVFQQRPCLGDIVVTNVSDLIKDPKLFNIITGENVTIDVGNQSTDFGKCYTKKAIPNDCALKVITKNNFELINKNEFSVDADAYFEHDMNPDLCHSWARKGNSKNSEVPPPWFEDEDSEIITENQEELIQRPELNIYPNPSTSKIELNITGLKATNGVVEVYSITGKRIYFGRISSEKTIIDVSNFSSGIYICKYINDNKLRILTKQIVIQNDAN